MDQLNNNIFRPWDQSASNNKLGQSCDYVGDGEDASKHGESCNIKSKTSSLESSSKLLKSFYSSHPALAQQFSCHAKQLAACPLLTSNSTSASIRPTMPELLTNAHKYFQQFPFLNQPYGYGNPLAYQAFVNNANYFYNSLQPHGKASSSGDHSSSALTLNKIDADSNCSDKSSKKQRPKRFQCPHCQVSFSNNGQLKGHIRIHTGLCRTRFPI